jgi:ketosteroid isomerase-like protein
MTRPLAVLLLALAAAACSHQKLPGTDIRETKDTKAIYAVVEAYARAMNARDAAAVLAQVAPDYYDDAGTPEPADDLDRPGLEKALAESFAKVEAPRLSLTLRKIEAQDDTGFAEVFYDSFYRVQTPAGAVARRDSDVHRIRLKRVDGAWKIQGGL